MELYSFSRLNTYETCPHQYYRQYVLHEKSVDNVYNVHGTIFHEMIEKLQKEKLSVEEALDQFDEILLKHSLSQLDFISDTVQDNYFDSIKNYIEYFTPYQANRIAIEYPMIEEFGSPREYVYLDHNGNEHKCLAPITIRGFIDMIMYFPNKEIEIIDFKTSSIYDKEHRKINGRQLIIYALGMMKKGYKVRRIGWDFVKYARTSFNGKRSKRVMRNKIVSEYQNRIYDKMIENGENEIIAKSIIDNAIEKNDLKLLPQYIQDLFTIEKEVVEHELSKESIQETIDFINNTVQSIENKSCLEVEYKARSITQSDNFFCSMLCGVKANCPAYKKFIESNKDNFKSKEDDGLDDLFRQLMG